MPEVQDIQYLEFLNLLSKAGVHFSVSQIDGWFNISSEEVVEYLHNPDLYLANRAGVAVEDWQRWRDYIFETGKTVPLKEFLSKPPKVCFERPAIPVELRWEMWERDNFTCKLCGSHKFLTIDHIIPVSKGGQTTKENLQTLCRNCNSKKSDG